MPRAEAGTTKFLNNKLKSKGLQRLRWYCQVCERQMRDENGFKCHTQSESHVRQMLVVGEDSKKFIGDYSSQFQRDFLLQLRTAHGEKKIFINHFYQEYIANKEHVHMNATRWPSLTEFAKFLGREGICRVEEGDKGLEIAWIDNSPEALRRQDAIRKKDRQDKGDEEREQRLIKEQISRAQKDTEDTEKAEGDESSKTLQRTEGETIKLIMNSKSSTAKDSPPTAEDKSQADERGSEESTREGSDTPQSAEEKDQAQPLKINKIAFGTAVKPKNVFASLSKKNPLASKKKAVIEGPQKPMSEVERIMKEETSGKRGLGFHGHPQSSFKKQRVQ